MFVRPCWELASVEEIFRLIESDPWALLVTNGDQGPYATNLPLLLDRGRGANGSLVGHIARANAHARALFLAKAPSLAVFHGPASYVTPSWYPGRDMPGTYYYSAVQCTVRVHPQSRDELEAAVTRLSDTMEAGVPQGWRTDEIPHSEITRRLPSIIGFVLEIERLEAKLKLGQDEPKRDALAVAERLLASPDPVQRRLGEMVQAANLGRPDEGA